MSTNGNIGEDDCPNCRGKGAVIASEYLNLLLICPLCKGLGKKKIPAQNETAIEINVAKTEKV